MKSAHYRTINVDTAVAWSFADKLKALDGAVKAAISTSWR
jgi:hypothetical protein